MKTSLRISLVLLVAAALAAAACALYAAGSASERASLRGVYPLRPTVDKLPVGAVAWGLDAKALKTIIETRLGDQKLPVDANGASDVVLTISISAQRDMMYAVHLRLECRQLVALFHEFIRDPESRMLAPTWSAT